MAVIGINPVRRREKKDALDKIAQGLSIANNVLGIGLAVPKFLQDTAADKEASALKQAEGERSQAELALKVGKETRGATAKDIEGAVRQPDGVLTGGSFADRVIQVPGFGARVPVTGGVDRGAQLRIDRLERQEGPPNPEQIQFLSRLDPGAAVGAEKLTFGEVESRIKSLQRKLEKPIEREKFTEAQLKINEGTKKALDKGNELFESANRVLNLIDDEDVAQVVGGTSGFIANIAASDILDKITLGQAKRTLEPKQLQFVRELGLHFQKFRKETTGAAASYTELAYLRPLQPSATDTRDQLIRSFQITKDAIRVARSKRLAEEALARPEDLRDDFLSRQRFNDLQEFNLTKQIIESGGRGEVRDLIEQRNPDVNQVLDRSGIQQGGVDLSSASDEDLFRLISQ
jgi:hypothetical protein